MRPMWGRSSREWTPWCGVEAFPNQLFQGSVEKIEPQAVVEQKRHETFR